MSELVHSKLFPLVHSTPDRNWFGLGDMLTRASGASMLYYYLFLTSPYKLLKYTWKFNYLWYGPVLGTAMTLALPVEPIAYGVVETARKIKDTIFPPNNFDSHSIFFVAPKGLIGSYIWDWHKQFSVYVTGFMICRDSDGYVHDDAVAHTWYDYQMDKFFWRGLLAKSNALIPREVARWKDGKLDKYVEDYGDVVFKLPDSFLGLGDLFLEKGKDFQTDSDIIKLLSVDTPDLPDYSRYGDKEVLILDWIRPVTDQSSDLVAVNQVHQLDILTINSADEGVKCFNVIYWGGCTDGQSSHSCTEGYLVDVETETITGTTVWYSAYFASMKAPLIGKKVPGVKKAVQDAINAHKNHPFSWCRVVGWDCIITNNGPVFFEGNLAAHRTPRRVTLDWPNAWAFATAFGL